MSGTVMKFGPQWIRTLTDGAASSSSVTNSSSTGSASSSNSNNNNINSASQSSANHSATSYISSSSTTSSSFNNNNNNNNSSSNGGAGKYKLAEYRYGREEMLALFEPDLDPPEDIKKFTDLYFDKARMPMAMTQMSDDEVKLSTRNWNSEAVLRSSSKVATTSGISGGPGGTSIPGGGIPGGPLGAAAGIVGSTLQDRDSRQLSDRGASGTMTAAGVLSSSPRGPPGSLSRMPLEQRGGLMSSLNSRGPTAIRNLVSRGPNLYNRSQSHDDETADEVGTTSGGGFESARFGLPGQSRQPSSLRSRFEVNRTLSSTTSGLKSTEAKGGQLVDGDLSNEQRRSVYDRLLKYNLDDKMVRKDVNGRPIQSGDWRSREWSGSGPDNRSSKAVTGDDRSWRTSRAGATEDWRSNNASNVTSTSSWYVRSDDQRNPRAAAAAASQSNLDPTGTGFNGKRDTLRRPSVDERQGDEEDEIQHRHRRDSLPEWSICDPLSGDKVGSFDATGAFREATIEDGSNVLSKEGKQDRSVFELKKQGAASGNAEQDWRPKQKNDTANTFNGIDQTANLNELEKLTLIEHNAIPVRNNETENVHNASNESRTKVSDNRRDLKQSSDRFGDFHNHQMNANKVDLQQRTSSPSNNDNEQKKSIDQTMNSSPPLRSSMNQALPETLQQMLKKANHNQQQSFISAISGSSNAVLPSNDEDGFAHLERAAEIMVAQWSAEEEHESSGSARFFGNKQANLIREQQNAQNNMIQSKNTDARLPNQAQQDQPTSQQQQQQHLQQLQQQQSHQQSGSEQNQANPSAMFDPNNQKKFILLPFTHEDSQQWFYRDTQGVIQGPFSATEMFEWYKAGYFVKELLVRRACDELFYPLGEVIKLWDRIPFAPLPLNHAPPPPITTQAFMQMRAIKQLELAGMNPAAQAQIPPNAFGLTHPGTVLLPGPLLAQQQQQVHPVLAAASMNRNLTGPQQDQRAAAGIRQMFDASRANEQVGVQQRAAHPGIVLDQNEMQAQLRQLLAQLKSREGFSNLNAQEQQEALVRQFVATQSGRILDPEQREMLMRARMMPFSAPFFANEQERFRYQQRLELEMQQKEEAEKQNRLIMEQRMKAEEENQRLMDELQKRQRKQKEAESEKHRQEAEKERILKLSQLKQQQLAKQQEEFRQMQQQQRLQQQQQQQEKQQQQQQKPQQAIQSNAAAAQQQQIERAKKAAQAQQVQQEQQRKTAWLTVSKPDQEPVSLATLQKMQEEEKEKERERQRQIQQQIQSNQQHQHQQLQQQLQRQMTWANAAQQPKPAPIKTLAEIQREEEERLAKEKQKKVKAQPVVPNAGVWNNAASHLNWKPPADS